jgi:hypothetical protein
MRNASLWFRYFTVTLSLLVRFLSVAYTLLVRYLSVAASFFKCYYTHLHYNIRTPVGLRSLLIPKNGQ